MATDRDDSHCSEPWGRSREHDNSAAPYPGDGAAQIWVVPTPGYGEASDSISALANPIDASSALRGYPLRLQEYMVHKCVFLSMLCLCNNVQSASKRGTLHGSLARGDEPCVAEFAPIDAPIDAPAEPFPNSRTQGSEHP